MGKPVSDQKTEVPFDVIDEGKILADEKQVTLAINEEKILAANGEKERIDISPIVNQYIQSYQAVKDELAPPLAIFLRDMAIVMTEEFEKLGNKQGKYIIARVQTEFIDWHKNNYPDQHISSIVFSEKHLPNASSTTTLSKP